MPDYKICPFSTTYIAKNKNLPKSDFIDGYFKNRFGHSNYTYTSSGREAINVALKYYNLNDDDCVTIFTTTGNFYISACVTKEIEKFCRWSRNIEPNTKIIFVNHEFGFPYENMEQLKQFNIPIIEDCAHSFFSTDEKSMIGKVGDFVIFSFPKMFPLQAGGLLVSNLNSTTYHCIDENMLDYLKSGLSFYIKNSQDIIETRKRNYNYLSETLEELGISPRFELTDNITPGVFMFKCNKEIDYPELKKFLYQNGIQCSVFYGEQSFFIPVHQDLRDDDLNYFKETIKFFINKKP